MNTIKNNTCPNCGSALTGEKCSYCGTLFFDFACLDFEHPFYIKFKHGNMIRRCKVRLTSYVTKIEPDDVVCYAENTPYYVCRSAPETIKLEMQIIPDGKLRSVVVDLDQIPDQVTEWPTL